MPPKLKNIPSSTGQVVSNLSLLVASTQKNWHPLMFWAWEYRTNFPWTDHVHKASEGVAVPFTPPPFTSGTLGILDYIQQKTQVLLRDETVSRTLDILEDYRKVVYVPLRCRYTQVKCSMEINRYAHSLYPTRRLHVFLSVLTDLPLYRTTHYHHTSLLKPVLSSN